MCHKKRTGLNSPQLWSQSVCLDCDGLTGHYIWRGHYCGAGVMSVNARVRLVPVFAGSVRIERALAAWAPPVYGSGFGVRGTRAPRHGKHAWNVEVHIWRAKEQRLWINSHDWVKVRGQAQFKTLVSCLFWQHFRQKLARENMLPCFDPIWSSVAWRFYG